MGWLGRLSPRRRIFAAGLAVLVAAAVVVAVVSVALARQDSAAGQPAGYPAQARPGPVLLVPGYGGNTNSLTILARRIRATGRQATVLHLPGNGTGSLAADASVLNAAVSHALGGGAPSVDVIGYSAGGVATLLWAREDGGAHKARRIVTLGSPFHGAELAADGEAFLPNACPAACRQLVPGSSLLTQLQAGYHALPAGLAVAVEHRRQDGGPAGLGPAGRRGQRAHPVALPGRADQPLRAADQPGGHRHGAAGHRHRPGPAHPGRLPLAPSVDCPAS